MAVLLSCSHCKRAVLLSETVTAAELERLLCHLGECRPNEPLASTRVEDILRHFRKVTIGPSPVDTSGRIE